MVCFIFLMILGRVFYLICPDVIHTSVKFTCTLETTFGYSNMNVSVFFDDKDNRTFALSTSTLQLEKTYWSAKKMIINASVEDTLLNVNPVINVISNILNIYLNSFKAKKLIIFNF